jgi:hypothetical protein
MNPKIVTKLTSCFLFLLISQLVFAQTDVNLENYKSPENSTFTKYTLIEPSSSLPKCLNQDLFVTDLFIITHTGSDVAHLVPAGYGYIPADLNKGAKGKHIYLAVQRSCVAKNLQTYLWSFSSRPSIGEYFLPQATYVPNSKGYGFPGADLNEGAGGNYIYLFYTRQTSLFLKDIYVMTANYKGASCDNGYIKSYDLNGGCGASTPYIHFCSKVFQ